MTLTAGALSQVSVGATVAALLATAATGGTGPYTQQWYRSTTSGFSPGGGNIISGATGLSLSDSGLIPNTQYFYKVVYTDTGAGSATITSSQLAVTTAANVPSQNSFGMGMVAGLVDLRFATNTVSVLIDTTQATALVPGSAVKFVDNADGVPKVVGCAANADDCAGFLNFDGKSPTFTAGMAAEMSMGGNCIYLYSTTAIGRGAQVTLDVAAPASVGVKVGSSGAAIVGWAYDKAPAHGTLIRVMLATPGYTKA